MKPTSWVRGFEAAKAASRYSIAPRIGLKVGAALFAKSTLLSIGFNTFGCTHPDSFRTDEWHRNIHAEHRAILKRQHYSDWNSVMYVYRERSDGTAGNCKPCVTCQMLMIEAGVRRVRFINAHGKMEEITL